MTRRKAAQIAIRVVVLSAVAGAFGGLSSYIMRVSEAQPAGPLAATHPLDQQVSNLAAKTDRLSAATPVRLAPAESKPYTLASVTSTPEIEAAARVPAPAATEPAQAAAPMPARKPKALPPPVAQPAANSFLDDTQIAGLRSRLQLTSDQVEYWPAVETALRDVVRTQFRGSRKHGHESKSIDVNSAEVQRLIYAAMPLLFRMREDQKHEIRKLARVMGLESVAAQI